MRLPPFSVDWPFINSIRNSGGKEDAGLFRNNITICVQG